MSAGIALFSAASNSCIILPFFMREPFTLRGNDARRHHLKFKLSEDAESAPRELRKIHFLRHRDEFLQVGKVART